MRAEPVEAPFDELRGQSCLRCRAHQKLKANMCPEPVDGHICCAVCGPDELSTTSVERLGDR